MGYVIVLKKMNERMNEWCCRENTTPIYRHNFFSPSLSFSFFFEKKKTHRLYSVSLLYHQEEKNLGCVLFFFSLVESAFCVEENSVRFLLHLSIEKTKEGMWQAQTRMSFSTWYLFYRINKIQNNSEKTFWFFTRNNETKEVHFFLVFIMQQHVGQNVKKSVRYGGDEHSMIDSFNVFF